jgi:hypothetical protein
LAEVIFSRLAQADLQNIDEYTEAVWESNRPSGIWMTFKVSAQPSLRRPESEGFGPKSALWFGALNTESTSSFIAQKTMTF